MWESVKGLRNTAVYSSLIYTNSSAHTVRPPVKCRSPDARASLITTLDEDDIHHMERQCRHEATTMIEVSFYDTFRT